jgi:hypothetical protein
MREPRRRRSGYRSAPAPRLWCESKPLSAKTMNITPNPAVPPPPQTAPAVAPANDNLVPVDNGPGAAPQQAQPAHPADGLQGLGDLHRIPEGLLEHIAGCLPPRDVRRLAAADVRTRAALRGPRFAAGLGIAAEAVDTRAGFSQLLGAEGTQLDDGSNTIRSLHPRLQASPLSALALRIHSFPLQDAQAALTDFLAAFNSLPEEHHTAALTNLARVAMHSTEQFSPLDAARQGANVQHALLFYGTTDHETIRQTEEAAAISREPRSAGTAARSAQNLQAVAEQFGMNSPNGRAHLELQAARSLDPRSAGAAARGGQHLPTVIANFRIVSNTAIDRLEYEAARSNEPGSAGHAVRNGVDVEVAYLASGFVSDRARDVLSSAAASAQNARR